MINKNEKDALKRRLVKNSIWSFISLFANKFGAFIFTIILARFLMPEKYGLYSLVLSVAMIFVAFADSGINGSLLRYIAFAVKSKKKKKISAYYYYLLKLKVYLALVVFSLSFILAYPLSFYLFKNPSLFIPFLVAAFYIFILSFDNFYTQIFYSIEKVKYVGIKDSIGYTLKIILILLVFYLVSSDYHIIGIFLSLMFVSTILIIFSLLYFKKLVPEIYLKTDSKIDKKRIRKFMGILTVAIFFSAVFFYIDSVILGIFSSVENVGYYRVAYSLVFSVVGILSFTGDVLLSTFTKLKKELVSKLIFKAIQMLLILIIPSIFGILIMGKYFIAAFFGYSYSPAIYPLCILSLSIFPSVLISIFLSLFVANEKPGIFAKLILITSVANIILNFFFIKLFLWLCPDFVTTGVAMATLISWFIYFFMSIAVLKKGFAIAFPFRFIAKPLFSSLIMSGVLVCALRFINIPGSPFKIFEIFLGAGTYFLALIMMGGIKRQDLNLIFSFFKKKNGV